MNQWFDNKKITPQELYELFDGLSELDKKDVLVAGDNLTNIVESIRNLALRKVQKI